MLLAVTTANKTCTNPVLESWKWALKEAAMPGPVVNCRAVRSNDSAEQIKGKFWSRREKEGDTSLTLPQHRRRRENSQFSAINEVFASEASFYVVNNQIKVRLRLDISICST